MDGERCEAGMSSEPVLVHLAISGLRGRTREGRTGGIKIGERKIYSLAYADDVVVMAEGEGRMMGMMKVLEKYLEGKRLELNVGKTRVVRCRRGEEDGRKWYGNGRTGK